MQKSKIQPVSKSKIIDYGNKNIERFWLTRNKNYQAEVRNYRDTILGVFGGLQYSVVCIQTEQIDDKRLIDEIFNAIKRKNRIYILTNEKPERLKELAGACLIRYGVKNIGSFILVNPNSSHSKGVLFTAPFLESSFASNNIALELDKNQINTLFRFFCNNFWNKATHEIIEAFETAKSTSAPPLDFLSNVQDFCDPGFIKEKISTQIENLSLIIPSLQPGDIVDSEKITNSRIFTSLKNHNNDLLNAVQQRQNQILANRTPTNLRLILSENGESWLIPKAYISKEDNFFALELNETQKAELQKNIVNPLFENAEYEYFSSKLRKELVGCSIFLVSNLNNELAIKAIGDKKAEDVNSTEFLEKSIFENQEPKFIDDDTFCQINYEWNINPFYLSENAKKAKIYEEWQNIEDKFKDICNRLEKSISENESKNVTERLKRFFLGKKQTLSKHREELDNYKSKVSELSKMEISERKELIKAFNTFSQNVLGDISEIDIEIKKSAIEDEIEKLKQCKKDKENELEQFIEKNEKEIEQKEKDKQQKLEEFCKKYNTSIDKLGKFRNELERKKGKAKDQQILAELIEIQGVNLRHKFEEDKRKKEKEIEKINQEIQRKEKEKSKITDRQNHSEKSSLEIFSGKEQTQKEKNSEFTIPEYLPYLPKIGELYEHNNQKFLVIEYWEDYEIGKQESERLNAKLCTNI